MLQLDDKDEQVLEKRSGPRFCGWAEGSYAQCNDSVKSKRLISSRN